MRTRRSFQLESLERREAPSHGGMSAMSGLHAASPSHHHRGPQHAEIVHHHRGHAAGQNRGHNDPVDNDLNRNGAGASTGVNVTNGGGSATTTGGGNATATGDDNATNHDVNDDNGVDPANHDANDDHGVDPANHDVNDDHGVAPANHDANDDNGVDPVGGHQGRGRDGGRDGGHDGGGHH